MHRQGGPPDKHGLFHFELNVPEVVGRNNGDVAPVEELDEL
jgi:hypothetical protein